MLSISDLLRYFFEVATDENLQAYQKSLNIEENL